MRVFTLLLRDVWKQVFLLDLYPDFQGPILKGRPWTKDIMPCGQIESRISNVEY